MTKAEAVAEFKSEILPAIIKQYGKDVSQTTVTVTLTFEVENVDERISEEDWKYAVYRAFDICDGRQPFDTEAMGISAHRVVECMAHTASFGMGLRRAERYRGLDGASWKLADLMPVPKVHVRSYVHATVRVGEVAFDSNG